MEYRVLLQAETPLSFRVGRTTTKTTTQPYIPGSSLLGALAQAHQMLGRPHDEFTNFFLRDQVLFSNGYPAVFEWEELQDEACEVLPIPITARTCKRMKGFRFGTDRDGSQRAGVVDGLSALALFALSGETQPKVLDHLHKHPQTCHRLDRFVGFFRRGAQPEHLGTPRIGQSLRTHVGINYATGTAHTAVLYSHQVLQAGSLFWGCWWVADDLAPAFRAFVEAAAAEGIIRVGKSRTRGLGCVTCNLAPYTPDTPTDLQHRVEAFTKHFKAAAVAAGIPAPAALYVPILLASDTLVYDDLLRHRLHLSPVDLGLFGIGGAELVYHAAGWRSVQGWSVYWGLPKADDSAISKGSVFLFALPEANDTTFAGLLRLQQERIGLRRAEGFGMVRVAHPFHTDLFLKDPAQGGGFR